MRNDNIFIDKSKNISLIEKNENISIIVKNDISLNQTVSLIEKKKDEEISIPESSNKIISITNSENSMKNNIDYNGIIEEWDFIQESSSLVSKNKMDLAWERYWSKYGECLIWASWLEKYANYINPEYLPENTDDKEQQLSEKFLEQNTCFPSEAHRNCVIGRSNFEGIFGKNEIRKYDSTTKNMNFSFDNTNKQEVIEREAEDNRKRIGNQLSPDIGEGWNPLSPFSVEDSYLASNAEDEKLITKCDSISGSITRTNATSDSMTNVTKMTLTSSSCDSASTQSSSLVSSTMSSNESNVTSSSSDIGNDYTVEDNDKYWQELWKENFQEQYKKHYETFMFKAKESVVCSEINLSDDKNYKIKNNTINDDIKSVVIEKNVSLSKKKMIMESVGMLMQNLTMSCETNSHDNCKENCLEIIDNDEQSVEHYNTTESDVLVYNIESKINSSLNSKNEVREMGNEEKPITLKRRYCISLISFDFFRIYFFYFRQTKFFSLNSSFFFNYHLLVIDKF